MTVDKKTTSVGIIAIVMTVITAICTTGLFD